MTFYIYYISKRRKIDNLTDITVRWNISYVKAENCIHGAEKDNQFRNVWNVVVIHILQLNETIISSTVCQPD